MTHGPQFPASISVVDSHTEGEPTRVVTAGWPVPNAGTMAERRDVLRRDFDHLRRAVVLEPRGHDAIVGALLTPPVSKDALAGVIFFNDVGYLGMCGHGLMGVVRTLAHMGGLAAGAVRIDTPVGLVQAELGHDGAITIENVASYRYAADVELDVPGVGRVHGDVAYGGNWFFLCELSSPALDAANIQALLQATMAIRDALRARGITGADGAAVDHVELFGPGRRPGAQSRNFVLCPGAAYDRSPCGTGTSAKMAVLHARGALALKQHWVQESITGSTFTGWLTEREGQLVPHIRGYAYITGDATLRFDRHDPFRAGWQAK